MLQLRRVVVIGLFLVAMSSAHAYAAVLCVTVQDFSRLPLPSAFVVVTDLVRSRAPLTAKTNSAGRACITAIPEGIYSVEAGLQGFLYSVYRPVRVTILAPTNLTFFLPIGEITEGGMDDESTLSGTLTRDNGEPAAAASICATGTAGGIHRCVLTDELGEYVLVVPAAAYDIVIKTSDGITNQVSLDASAPGSYRNRLTLPRASPGR